MGEVLSRSVGEARSRAGESGGAVARSAPVGSAALQRFSELAHRNAQAKITSHYAQLLNARPGVGSVVQRIKMMEIQTSREEVWEGVTEALEGRVPGSYWPAMKKDFEATVPDDAEYEYYDEIADLLTERLNAKEGTAFEVGGHDAETEDDDDDTEPSSSSGWSVGSLMWKALKGLTIGLAVQKGLGAIPTAEASPVPRMPLALPSPDMVSSGNFTSMISGSLTTVPSGNLTIPPELLCPLYSPHQTLMNELALNYAMMHAPSDPSTALQVYRSPEEILGRSSSFSPLDHRSLDEEADDDDMPSLVDAVPDLPSPEPTALTAKNVTMEDVKPHGGGASGAHKAKSVDFGSGRTWGTTFLKDAQANANVGDSTVRSSMFNAELLSKMGVVVPEIEYVDHGGKGTIASRGLDGGFTALDKHATPLTHEQRVDYAKLTLLSPVADMHKGNVGLSGGKLGTNDVDTSAPYLTHWHSRLLDRFQLPEERYETSDVGSNYLSQGRSQDHVLHGSIKLQARDVVKAMKGFAAISREDLTAMAAHYPLQGPASQKLALYSMLKQQEAFREAFSDFEEDVTDETAWQESDSYEKLQTVLAEYEESNQFPYKFEVKAGKLQITPNEHFERPDGTEVWEDAVPEHGVVATNPGLAKAIHDGHFGDAVLRLGPSTALAPDDIPGLIGSAKAFTRSIGSGNPVVELVAKLVLHPSFGKMSGKAQGEVKALFAKDTTNGNPLRQAFFPQHLVGEPGKFRSDNFYQGGKAIVRSAYDKLASIGAT